MRIVSLASGSSGNATLVEHDGDALLIDCGVSCKQVRERIAAAGFDPQTVRGILITHNHDDHVSGLRVSVGRCFRDVPVFANMLTAEAVARQTGLADDAFVCFENGQPFEIGAFEVGPFSIPHDAADPVGFLIRAGAITYFHGTDIGTPLDFIGLKLREADVATLESNHDAQMLRRSDRAESLKQRIAGPHGHLSNDDAADLVRRFASPRLRKLSLAHLSGECNAPHLAEQTMRATLEEMGRADVELEVLSRERPGRVWTA